MNTTEKKFLAFIYAIEKIALACEPCKGYGTIWPPTGHARGCEACAPIRDALLKHRPRLYGVMDLATPRGAKIVFHHPRNGRGGDVESGRLHLTIGAEYTLDRIDVHDYSSTVYLVEVPKVPFNSVQFANTPLQL